jgi:hypothetical protein
VPSGAEVLHQCLIWLDELLNALVFELGCDVVEIDIEAAERAHHLHRALDPLLSRLGYGAVIINITLLFSVARYEEVAEAYLRALERRAAVGERLDNIASVASFFLSRIGAGPR